MKKNKKIIEKRRSIVSYLLGFFFLALFLVGGRYVVELQSRVLLLQDQVEEVSSEFEMLLGRFEATQNSHGAAILEMDDLTKKILTLESLVQEQDRILQDMSLQISQ